MAKGQRRSNKEARKVKDPQKGGKKSEGPKYLRQSDVLQTVKLGAKRPGNR